MYFVTVVPLKCGPNLENDPALGCYQKEPVGGLDIVTETSRLPWGLSVLGSSCLLSGRNCGSQCQFGKKEKNYLFKSYTCLE